MIFLVLKGKGAAATQWVNNKILIDRSNYIFINKLFDIDLDKYDSSNKFIN
jgi:acyl-CoA hydrolase